MRACRAAIFDLFYTLLYDEGTGTREKAIEVAERAGIPRDDWLRGWRAAGDEATLGNPGTTRGRVRRALVEAGYQGGDEHLADELTGLLFARHIPRLYPDTRDTLSQLRTLRYRLGLVSNCFGDERHWPAQLELDSCFDTMVLSCEVGMAKPEPGIYRLAADQLDVAPEECVFVDDVPSYVAGAMAVGMAGVRINRFESEGPYAEHRAPAAEPELTIRELRELVQWLDERQGA
jgi:putative hydrolase of the HAD superfamily